MNHSPASPLFVTRHRRARTRAVLLAAASVVCLASAGVALATDAAPVKAASTGENPSGPPQTAPARTFEMSVPVVIRNQIAGEVTAQLTTAGVQAVDAGRLIGILTPFVSDALMGRIVAISGGKGMVSLTALEQTGLEVTYDPLSIQLEIRIPKAEARDLVINLQGDNAPTDRGAISPARFSIAANLFASQAYVHEASAGETGFDPFQLELSGYANVFGKKGLYLAYQGFYAEDAPKTWRRGNVVAFHDDVDRAIRYSGGDIFTPGTGFQALPTIGGLSIQRAYDEIQPFRNTRASGRDRITIERPSNVEIIVNGAVVRRIRLDPGTYDFRDLPLADGVNDVVFVVEDDQGRREVFERSLILEQDLLAEGVLDFGLTFGAPQRTTDGSIDYDTEALLGSGYIRYGVTNNLTLGANAQANDQQYLVGLDGGIATAIGSFSALAGLSGGGPGLDDGLAISIGYTLDIEAGETLRQLQLGFEHRSRDFAPVGTLLPSNPFESEYTFRYQQALWDSAAGSISYRYSQGRDAVLDEQQLQVGVSQSFGNIIAFASYQRTERENAEAEDTLYLTLTWLMSSRENARARYDSRTDTTALEWDRARYDGVNQWGANVGLARSPSGYIADGRIDYAANRFLATLGHDTQTDEDGNIQLQRSRYSAGVGFGFADGKAAFGRPATEGFAIVDTHKSLKDRRVSVGDPKSIEGVRAHSDMFGPAFVEVRQPYQREDLPIDVEDLPTGYDIGGSALVMYPGARSGYALTIGSGASNTVIGRLVNADGTPAALLSGKLVPVAGDEAVETTFFTNRTGRLSAERLAPGRYSVILNGSIVPIGEIVVPEDANGLVEIGTLTISP